MKKTIPSYSRRYLFLDKKIGHLPGTNPKHVGILATAELRQTKARFAVLTILESAKQPLSAKEIAVKIPKRLADQVTVYRILNSFVEEHVACQVNLRHGHTDYELERGNHHHHLVCTQCGKVEDFDDCDITPLIKKILRTSSFTHVSDHAIELFGFCKKCS